jgi:hypothetical protein
VKASAYLSRRKGRREQNSDATYRRAGTMA